MAARDGLGIFICPEKSVTIDWKSLGAYAGFENSVSLDDSPLLPGADNVPAAPAVRFVKGLDCGMVRTE